MTTYNLQIMQGYTGPNITAMLRRDITLPFAPVPGILLDLNDNETTVTLGASRIEGTTLMSAPLTWDEESQSFRQYITTCVSKSTNEYIHNVAESVKLGWAVVYERKNPITEVEY